MKHSIGVKIFIIAILLAAVAQVSNGLNYMGMKKISNLSLKITDEYLQSKNNLETVSNQLSELQKQILFYYIESDDSKRKDIENKITATKGTLVSAIDSLKKGADSDRETEELEELEKQYNDYVEIYDKAVSLNNENEAMELINGEIKERGEKVSTYLESVNIINKANIIRSKREQAQAEKMYVITLTFAVILTILVLILCLFIIIKKIINPIKHAKNKLNYIIDEIENNNGNLTERIDIETKDEISELVYGINKFMDTLQRIIKKIQGESSSLKNSVTNVLEKINVANESASDTSATMEELAASMEEVSASTIELSNSSVEVYNSMDHISDKAKDGSQYAEDIKKRANDLKDEAVASKNSTYDMAEKISEVVKNALVNCKSVNEIESLTSEILEISEQTNLLALNASIEAARAGEAGKSFSVVAEEIRELADNSKNTANDIQEISKKVINAVEELADNSSKMLGFINDIVLKDYDKLVSTGEQYNKDANIFDEILLHFVNQISELKNTMADMKESIKAISETVEQSANAVGNVAGNSTELVSSMDTIQEEMNKNDDISNRLMNEVDKFKNV